MEKHSLVQRLLTASLLSLALFGPIASAEDVASPEEQSAEISDPVSQAEIAQRIAELATERADLARQLAQSDNDEYLLQVAERLEQIELQLKAQADLADMLALQPGEADDTLPEEAPSAYRLNALYDQVVVANSALGERRDALMAARERQQELEERARESANSPRLNCA